MAFRRCRLPGDMEGQYILKKSYDKAKVARFFHTVISTKVTWKVVEKRVGYDGEDVE